MKTKLTITLLTVLGALALAANAQDNNPPQDGPPQGGGQGKHGQRPPLPAIVKALDANHDGVIDADEIANASNALKTLDKDGDGKLSMQEAMGPRPQMRNGKGQGRPPGGDDSLPPNGPPPGEGDNGAPPAGGPPGQQ